MTNRSLSIWVSCLMGLAITPASFGQAPPADNTRSEAEWGQFLAKNPEVMGVHLARLEKTIEEQRGRIDELLGRINTLEKRKPPPINSASLPFSVRDGKGKPRFVMTADGEGDAAVMVILDGNGNPRIGFSAGAESGTIQVNDGSGRGLATLEVDADGGTLEVKNVDGRSVNLDGGLGVRVRGANGNSHAQIYTDGKSGQVSVYGGAGGYAVVQLRTISSGAGRLTLSNADGSYLLDAGAATDGTGLLKMGPNGNGAAGIIGSAGKAASSLQGRQD